MSIERVMKAAQMANAHSFIMASTDEYSTQCGERGVQLSGMNTKKKRSSFYKT